MTKKSDSKTIKNYVGLDKLFLISSLFLGFLLIFIIPPFQSPDEDSHFIKSYMISVGNFFPEKSGDMVGYPIPKIIDDYIENKLNFASNRSAKYTYNDVYYDQLLSYDYNAVVFKPISTQNTVFVAHIIPSIGIKIASFIHAFDKGGEVGPAVLLQFARFLSLVVYTLIGYFAIKITPKFKKTFFVILMLPSSIILRSVVTYDSLLLVIVALSVAKMLKLYLDEENNFTKWDIIIFTICGFILFNVKTVYSVIFLLMFFIPNKKFGSLKNKVIYFSIMIGLVLLLTFINRIPYLSFEIVEEPLKMSQIDFILHHPIKYVVIFIQNFINQMSIQNYWMVSTFGLLDTYNPVLINFIVYLNLFFIIFYDIYEEKINFSFLISGLYLIFAILAIFLMYTSMYVLWTPHVLGIIGGNEITGIQGRYFLPCLFLIPLVLSNKIINKFLNYFQKIFKCFKKLADNDYFITFGCIIISIFILIVRFWI